MHRGDYAAAEASFREAQDRQADLNPTERADLARLMTENAHALTARRSGTEQLRLAEKALADGHSSDAQELLRKLSVNEQYLTKADRDRYQQLAWRANGQSGTHGSSAEAQAKLRQARAVLARYDFESAEALVNEAARLNAPVNKGDDTPQAVTAEIAKVKADPQVMLSAARAAFKAGNLDRAEMYAHISEQVASAFTFTMFSSDSPAKLLKEIQVARAQGPRKPDGLAKGATQTPATRQTALKPDASNQLASTSGQPAPGSQTTNVSLQVTTTASGAPAGTAPVPPTASTTGSAELSLTPVAGSPDTDQARKLLVEARVALTQKDYPQARLLVDKARALHPTLSANEDSPDKVLADILMVSAGAPVKPANQPISTSGTRAEALVLLKQGRDLLAHNQLEDASAVAVRARAIAGLHWGLFEDTPDKLFQDAEKARAKRDQDESPKVLAEARKAYEAGDYDKATQLAYKARKMHGPYTIMDLGDRPDKLLVDIETARAHVRRQPGTMMADQKSDPRADEERRLLADARAALKAGDTQRAQNLALQARQMNVVLNRPNDDSPDAVLRDVNMVRANPGAVSTGVLVMAPATGTDGARPQADNLVAQARALQKQGRFAEAYQVAVQAQQLGAMYRPEEDSPTVASQQIMAQARTKFETLLRTADDLSRPGESAAHGQQAEVNLMEARQLAMAFHQDTQPVDVRLTRLKDLRAVASQSAPGTPVGPTGPATPVAQGAPNSGHLILDKARLELNHGQVANARRMCIEVIDSGDAACREEALAVLRTVEAEENNQRALEARRAFDAAVASWNRRDFANASAILATVDVRLLDAAHQNQLREIMLQPEMQPRRPEAVQTVAMADPAQGSGAPTAPPGDGAPTAPPPPAPLQASTGDAPGHSIATDQNPQMDVLIRAKQMRDVHFQEMREKGLKTMSLATEKFKAGQIDTAIDMLKSYNTEVHEDKELDPKTWPLLCRPVETRIKSFELSLEQARLMSNDPNRKAITDKEKIQAGFNAEQLKNKKVAELMKQYNALYKQAKYEEAERVALLAKEVDPDNPIVTAAIEVARRAYRRDEYASLKGAREQYAHDALNEAENPGDPRAAKDAYLFSKDPKVQERMKNHKSLSPITLGRKSEREKEIESKLYAPVSMNFSDEPLGRAIEQLAAWNNINIYVDRPALVEEGVNLEQPVSLRLDQVSLKSALILLLHQAKLTWIIKDEVLQVTTERAASGKLEQRAYEVADLVIPIPEFGDVTKQHPAMENITPPNPYGGTSPVNTPNSLQGGTPTGSPSSYGSTSALDSVAGSNGAKATPYGPSNTREAELIQLIVSTIQPHSWAEMGGPGTIQYHPPTHGLVVNQTGDIQEQIQDLLAALRRLQDQEVAVEVRFISIIEDFYERIGVSFNMNIQENQNTRFFPALNSGQFGQPGFLQQFSPSHFISGLVNPGQLSPDTGIPIVNTSFAQNIPEFGGYAPGLQVGIAFLSDIQVFLFMEAAQGDTRTNIMQAPKLTLFNGQTATLSVGDTQTFVTNITGTLLGNGSLIFTPSTTAVPNTTNLTLQAVISADRRFVRLSLNPTLTNLVPAPVNLFPIVVPFFPNGLANPVEAPVLLTQNIQQPITDTINVATTVAVPDGGTVVLGGMKRLSEERSESGPPIVSKIPYISRLFKNTAYGRETESLLIMVTPRIIIQEEEEIRQTGFIANPGG
jgi:type II secretory pathway component GspD/PulD (secretin)